MFLFQNWGAHPSVHDLSFREVRPDEVCAVVVCYIVHFLWPLWPAHLLEIWIFVPGSRGLMFRFNRLLGFVLF